MRRRNFVVNAGCVPLAYANAVAEVDTWGALARYPTGWGLPPRMSKNKELRVGNYSGGFEAMLPFRTIQCGAESVWRERPRTDLRYRWGFKRLGVDDYLAKCVGAV